MTKEAEVTKKDLNELKLPGKILSLVKKSRVSHWCFQGKHTIKAGSSYFKVEQAGGSVRALKFPDCICIDCMGDYVADKLDNG